MVSKPPHRIAVFVDGDNIPPKQLDELVSFVSRIGFASIRRLYMGERDELYRSWKDPASTHGFRIIRVPTQAKYKNQTDIALVIGAMEVLYTRNVDGICLASSDSDCSSLTQHIREKGVSVYGFGKKETLLSFQKSCDYFHIYETRIPDLTPKIKPSLQKTKASKPKTLTPPAQTAKEPTYYLRRDTPIFHKCFQLGKINEHKNSATLSAIGKLLRIHIPEYNLKNYRCATLGKLYLRLGKYKLLEDKNTLEYVKK